METCDMSIPKDVALALTQYREFHSALAELRGGSDHELAKAGLARGDVARAAFETAERRVAALHAVPARRREARHHPATFSPARA
jgi:hypothetical protein